MLVDIDAADDHILAELIEDARYAPYLERQTQEIASLQRNDAVRLRPDQGFASIPGLSKEMVERLTRSSPQTLGEASRIRGVTPAALSAIMLHVKR
jgi:tRNA uridine 5-carboxymethylaminomethyl modification enzyme